MQKIDISYNTNYNDSKRLQKNLQDEDGKQKTKAGYQREGRAKFYKVTESL